MKKILLFLFLSVSSSFALVENFTFDVSDPAHRVTVDASQLGFLNPGTKDWIGVYKEGASNSWNNVQAWTWVKTALDEGGTTATLSLNLPAGNYVVRYFLNNSYATYKERAFTIKGAQEEAKLEIFGASTNAIFVDSTTSGVGNKDWIGIYKKGASNSWNNVIAWTWCYWDNGEYNGLPPIINFRPSLQNGEYEARLFYHNSYKVEDKISFTINDAKPNEEKIFPASQTWNGKNGEYIDYNEPSYESNGDDPDKAGIKPTTQWIGIFRKGAERKRENLIAWTWIGYRIPPNLTYYNKRLLLDNGKSYDIVYFRGSDYSDPKETGNIIIKW